MLCEGQLNVKNENGNAQQKQQLCNARSVASEANECFKSITMCYRSGGEWVSEGGEAA